MKKAVLFLAGVLGASLFAADYVWTGGGVDSSSWNDAGNWSPSGIPGGGDSASFPAAATITGGIAVEGGELKISVGKDVALVVSGVISGSGAMHFSLPDGGASKIALSGANTYSGGTTVTAYSHDSGNGNVQVYGVWLENAAAFGSCRTVSHQGGLINFNCADAVFGYDFVPSGSRSVRYNAMVATVIDGSVCNDGFDRELTFCCRSASAKLTVNKAVGGANASHVNVLARMPQTNESLFFKGGIASRSNIRPNTTGDGWSCGRTSFGGCVKAASLVCAYNSYVFLDDEVLDAGTVLDFTGYSDGQKGIFLNGHSQTANRIKSQSTGTSSTARHITSESPAVLTLKMSASSLVNMSAINGAVTLVVDALDSSYVQQFSNRVSTTTGDLVSSNGVLRIGKNATFKNVPRLEASGGIIEVVSEVANSLSGVREIRIEKGGRISLPSTALKAKAAAVSIDGDSLLEVTDGATLELASLVVGGEAVLPGVYPAGTYPQISVAVSVPLAASADSSGVWTGAGATEASSDAANWEGGYPGMIPVMFATGGSRALLTSSMEVSELKFDTPESVPDFTIAAHGSAPNSKIILSGHLMMTNASQSCVHTNTIGVPLTFTENISTVRVDGAGNTLVLGGALGKQNGSIDLTRTGSGTVLWTASDSSFSAGMVRFYGGVNYVYGGSLGGSAESPLAVQVDANVAPSYFYFCGGVHNGNFTFLRSSVNGVINSYDFRFLSGTTNTVNGFVRSQNGTNLKYVYEGDSRTVLRGGYETTWIYSFWLESHLYRGAELEILDKPLRAINSGSARGCFYAHSTGGSGDCAKVVFGAEGNFSQNGIFFGGPMKVEMDVDFAFNTNSAGVATALGFMQVPSTVNNDNAKPVVMDLRGRSQRFGPLRTVPSSVADNKVSGWNGYWGPSSVSYITSETPATLYALQDGEPNKESYPWRTTFRGAVSLVKEGPNTLVLSGVNTTSGRLEVAGGRLEFVNDGSWLETDEVALSGGTLVLDRRGRIGLVDLSVNGGTVEIAAGVNQRVKSLRVCENGTWRDVRPGRYFAGRLPEVVSGEGSVSVVGAGTRIIVR